MGMDLKLLRISDQDIDLLEKHPEGINSFIKAGEPVVKRPLGYAKACAEMARNLGLPLEEEPVTLDFETYPFQNTFSSQKMWHGLYYLLTGTAYEGPPPAGWLLNSPGVGEDLGYGPAMAISGENTKTLSVYLNGLDRQTVLDRFDGAAMLGLHIYPNIWDEDEGELKAELGVAFDGLRAYCSKCAEYKFGMLSYII